MGRRGEDKDVQIPSILFALKILSLSSISSLRMLEFHSLSQWTPDLSFMLHLITFALKLIITSPDQTDKMHVIIFYESVAFL